MSHHNLLKELVVAIVNIKCVKLGYLLPSLTPAFLTRETIEPPSVSAKLIISTDLFLQENRLLY
jgi:hypothetical protein